MQLLDEHGGSPTKTFEYIGKFADAIARYRGEAFNPRITEHTFDDVTITLIEPPCGSNTTILRYKNECLFVDTGYACYQSEMLHIIRAIIPNFDTCSKEVIITHADLDHCGLLNLFDTVYVSQKSWDSLVNEYYQGSGFRESNRSHAPYIRICKLLSGYVPPAPQSLRVIGGTMMPVKTPLEYINDFFFASLHFEVWESAGGHLPGEVMLVNRAHKIAFTGDIFINVKESTKEQSEYNRYAPYLMTSVDSDPALAATQRQAMKEVLGRGEWTLFGGHGYCKKLVIE
jgi:glyoxylase-like metal-dependent hydrolase (beta-lactamase superfamily II)